MSRTLKQTLIASAASYAGIALGMLNRLVLFPLAFVGSEVEYWGLAELFVIYASVISTLSNFGRSKIVMRYLPGFKGDSKSLLAYAWKGSVLGAVFTIVALYLLKDQVSGLSDQPNLFSEYYFAFLLILLALISFEWASGVMISRFKAHVPMVFNQFILRVFTTVIMLAKWLDWLDIHQFIYAFAGGYILVNAVMFVTAWRIEPHMISVQVTNLPEKKEMNTYGWYGLLNGSSAWLFQQVDSMVMGGFSLVNVAFLGIAKNIANVFSTAGRSLTQSLNPVVAKALQENDKQKLESVLVKSAGAQLFAGGFILLFIWANLDLLLYFFSKRFASAGMELKWIILLLGIGRLMLMSTGVASTIINKSKYYKFNFIANLVFIAISVAAMLWLIPIYGLLGAALSQGVLLILNSISRLTFLKVKLGLFPFTMRIVPLMLIVLGLLGSMLFEWTENIWMTAVLRSIAVAGAMVITLKFFPPIDELNEMLRPLLNKLKGGRKK